MEWRSAVQCKENTALLREGDELSLRGTNCKVYRLPEFWQPIFVVWLDGLNGHNRHNGLFRHNGHDGIFRHDGLNAVGVEMKKASHLTGFYSCGGRTRTCDLQVMSLASYQLLHSAIFPTKKGGPLISECKGTAFFANYQTFICFSS